MSMGGSAPKPPKALVEAQVRSMGVQDDAIKRILEIYDRQEQANAELRPLQKEALQFGLDSSRQAYAQSQADREWLLGRRNELSGLQDTMVNEARAFNTEAEQQKRADAAGAMTGQALADQQASMRRTMAALGVNPNSGRAITTMERAGVESARMMAGAQNAGRAEARAEGRMLTDRAANALAGYPAMSMSATGQGAAAGANTVNTANAGAAGINAGYGAMTGTVGAAGQMAGSMGNNAASMYSAMGNLYSNSRNAQGELLGAGIGSAATIGAALI